MNSPLVSVCCLTYNHASYISECLDGFLKQKTDFEIEILIHDDASTDGTQDIIREYELKHPRLFKPIYQSENQYSKGVSPTFSFNFPRAKGKYIALCEGDDYWTDPLKLQKQVDFLEKNEEYVITYHDAKIIDESGSLISDSQLPYIRKKDFTDLELKETKYILTLSMVFRNCINNYPSNLLKVYNGDMALISWLGNYGKGKYLGEIYPANYRKHDGGVWSKEDEVNRKVKSLNTPLELLKLYKKKNDRRLETYFYGKLTQSINDLSNLPLSSEMKNNIVKFILKNLIHIGFRNGQYYLRKIYF